MLPVDIRDAEKELYKAEIVSENELILTIPSLPFIMLYDSTRRHEQLMKMGINCERCQEAQEITLSNVLTNSSRSQKKLRLLFPEDIVLANMTSAVDSVLENREEPYLVAGPWDKQYMMCNMTWRVARVESHRKTRGSGVKTTSAKLHEMFSRMSTTTPT